MERSIAIIEDDFLLSLVMEKHLIKEGYSCHCFAKAEDFLDFLDQGETPIHTAVLDIKLKGEMDGIELYQILKQHYKLPIVFATGNSDLLKMRIDKSDDIYGILIKPIALEELSAILNSI